MRRHFTFAGIALLVAALLLPIAAAGWVAFTPEGLAFVISRIPRQIGPARLGIGHVSGTLVDGMELDLFTLEHERVSLRVEHLKARIDLLPLLWQSLDVTDASIGYAFVDVHRRRKPPTKTPLHFLPRFLALRADGLTITTATVVLPNGQRLDVSRATGSSALRWNSIRVYSARVELGELHGDGSLELRATDPMELEADTRWTWHAAEQPRWALNAHGKGSLDRLAITAAFTAPFRADLHGTALDLTREWHWVGSAVVEDFNLRPWGGSDVLGRIQGALELKGDARGFGAQGTLESGGLDAGPFEVALDGSYASRVLTATRIHVTHASSRAELDATGDIGIVANGPRLALRGTWRDFRWPLAGRDPPVRSPAGAFTLDGTWPYAVTLRGPLSVAALDRPLPLTLNGRLAKTGLSVSSGTAGLYGGEAQFSSELTWAPVASWAVNGRMRGFDPSTLRPEFPGHLDFDFDARGNAFGVRSDLDASIAKLSGRLRGTQASGSGAVRRRGDRWEFHELRAQSGQMRLALDGTIDAQRDLRFDLAADDLALLSPDSGGSVRARGEIRGTRDDPVVRLTGSGHAIHHAGVTVAGFTTDVDYDPRGGYESHVKAHATGVAFAGRTLDEIDVALTGRPALFSLSTALRAAKVRLAMQGAGPLLADGWHGTISALSIDDDEHVALRLGASANLLASTRLLRAERLCLRDGRVTLCGEGAWSADGWSASVEARNLPMATLTAGVTPDVTYDGALNIIGRASGGDGTPAQGSLRADLVDAGLRHRAPSGREEVLALGSGVFTLEALPQSIRADFDLDAAAKGNMRGTLSVQRIDAGWQSLPVRGDLRASSDALGFVTLYVPDIDRAAGRIDTDLVVGGTLGSPSFSGLLKIANGECDLYQINLALRQIALEARFIDNRLDLDANAHAGEGTSHVAGTIAWRDGQPHGSLHLTGKELRVVNVPEARIFASPDLTFSVDGRRIDVKGTVDVPYARIIPANLTGAVLASSDEVIVGEESRDPAVEYKVRTEITLKLGDRVSIDTTGLTGRLTGNLTTTTDTDKVTRGQGELKIEEGKYVAYGRKLDIERGRLIFAGGPVADPGIDIRAIKEFPDIKAGVNVRGTLRAPRITFFSDPAVPQSQIVSLVLAGGSLESLQSTNGGLGTTAQNQNNAARNEVLAQGGAILAQQLGSKIGLEDVGLESNLANETSLVLGKYLSPRLYVSYGIGITQAISGLKTRYTINDRWTIRTEAGGVTSADLVYTREK